MTNLERKHADFETLSSAYLQLRRTGASNALLVELLNHVSAAHGVYMLELHQTIADAVAGEEVG